MIVSYELHDCMRLHVHTKTLLFFSNRLLFLEASMQVHRYTGA